MGDLNPRVLDSRDELLGAALTRLDNIVHSQLDLLRLQLHAEHLRKDAVSGDDAGVDEPPVKEIGPTGEAIGDRHCKQVPKDDSQGEVETLDRLLDDVCLGNHHEWDVQNVRDYRSLPIPFGCPVEG